MAELPEIGVTEDNDFDAHAMLMADSTLADGNLDMINDDCMLSTHSVLELEPPNIPENNCKSIPIKPKPCFKIYAATSSHQKALVNINPNNRGRPRAIEQLDTSKDDTLNRFRCDVCSRGFTRMKALEIHMRIHTGKRPYVCDYPDCNRTFCQKGQLNTHKRLHVGVKPYACSIKGCQNRYMHSNRHCSQHPMTPLRKLENPWSDISISISEDENLNPVTEWLASYISQKENSKKRNSSTALKGNKDIIKKPTQKKTSDNGDICSNQTIQGALALIELSKDETT